MSRIDLTQVWSTDPTHRSGRARLLGVVRLSAKQLRHRFLESLLIVLGIALGVGVLTGMETFLRYLITMEEEIFATSAEMQAVQVQPKRFDLSQFFGADGVAAVRLAGDITSPATLRLDDVLAARAEIQTEALVTLGLQGTSSSRVVALDGAPFASASDAPMLGLEKVTPDTLLFDKRSMIAGRWITWEEFEGGQPVMVIEEQSVPILFPDVEPEDAIGRTVTMNLFIPGDQPASVELRVVGVVAEKEQPAWLAALLADEGNTARGYVPYFAAELESASINQINFTPLDESQTDELIRELELFFERRLGADRVTVSNPIATLRTINANRRSTSLTLMSLAGLALLVAAVNILNLFTARVIRRRRVTAMSVALGAERRSLFGRILTEALLLGVGGSAIGLLVAVGVVALLRVFLMGEMGVLGLELPRLSLGVADALFGLGVGMVVSLLFGIYPAYLSASVDPADGLRRE